MRCSNQSNSKREDFAESASGETAGANVALIANEAARELAARFGPFTAAVALLGAVCTLLEGRRGMAPVVAVVGTIAARLRARCQAHV